MRLTRIVVSLSTLAVGTLVIGCSDVDEDAHTDAGISFDARAAYDGGAHEPLPPAPPEPPRAGPTPAELPVLTPCPDGWREVAVAGVPACDPWPATGRASCTGAEAHFPGEPGCRRVGGACETDGWPSGLPATGVVYARAGAPGGGDGSRATPYDRIGDALAVASSGTVVAIAAGEYPEDLVVPDGVTLWGACSAGTTVSGAGSEDGVVTLVGAAAVARDLRVTGDRVAFWATGGAQLTMRGVVIEDALLAGIFAVDSDVTLEDVVIRRPRPGPGGENGRGVSIAAGTLAADRLVIEDAREIAIFLGTTDARLADVAVLRTLPQVSDGFWGHALHGQVGSRVTVERGAFEDNHRIALGAGGDGGELRLTDVVVRRTHVSNETSRAIDVEEGAHLAASRVLVDEHEELSVFVSGATFEVADMIVSRTTVGAPGVTGRGVGLQESATGTLTRLLVDHSHDTGVFVGGLGTDATLTDTTVSVVEHVGDITTSGRGVSYQEGARGTVSRLVVRGASDSGLLIASAGTSVSASDVTIRRSADALYRRGVSVVLGGSLDLSRALVMGHDELGLFVAGEGALLRAEDVLVRDTTGDGSADERIGRGVGAQEGSRLELSRVSIERVGDSAITCVGPDVSCTIADLTVVDVAPNPDGEYGRGIQAQQATLDLSRASFTRASEVGLTALSAGTVVRASDLVIRETRSGARGHLGRGVMALDSARIEIARGLFEQNHEIALGAFVGAELLMTDVVVRDTLARPCSEDLCEGLGAGVGAGAYLDGRIDIERFVVEGSALAGLQIARDGEIDARDGLIRNNPIGANVQVPDYDLTRISERVRYEDNDRGLDATDLFIPPP